MKIIKDKDVITFYGITWNDGWEFGAPSVITSPGYFYSDTDCLDGLIEELCINLSGGEKIDDEGDIEEWRGWQVEQFDKFIKDSFEKIPTTLPDYFKEFKKEIGHVWIIKKVVQFVWNNEEEYYDCIDIFNFEKSVDL